MDARGIYRLARTAFGSPPLLKIGLLRTGAPGTTRTCAPQVRSSGPPLRKTSRTTRSWPAGHRNSTPTVMSRYTNHCRLGRYRVGGCRTRVFLRRHATVTPQRSATVSAGGTFTRSAMLHPHPLDDSRSGNPPGVPSVLATSPPPSPTAFARRANAADIRALRAGSTAVPSPTTLARRTAVVDAFIRTFGSRRSFAPTIG